MNWLDVKEKQEPTQCPSSDGCPSSPGLHSALLRLLATNYPHLCLVEDWMCEEEVTGTMALLRKMMVPVENCRFTPKQLHHGERSWCGGWFIESLTWSSSSVDNSSYVYMRKNLQSHLYLRWSESPNPLFTFRTHTRDWTRMDHLATWRVAVTQAGLVSGSAPANEPLHCKLPCEQWRYSLSSDNRTLPSRQLLLTFSCFKILAEYCHQLPETQRLTAVKRVTQMELTCAVEIIRDTIRMAVHMGVVRNN